MTLLELGIAGQGPVVRDATEGKHSKWSITQLFDVYMLVFLLVPACRVQSHVFKSFRDHPDILEEGISSVLFDITPLRHMLPLATAGASSQGVSFIPCILHVKQAGIYKCTTVWTPEERVQMFSVQLNQVCKVLL